MIRKQDYNGLTWIDLETPTEDELKQISTEYNIHPLVGKELSEPSLRSKVDLYSDFIYLILHFPICSICYGEKSGADDGTQEIDFVIGKNFLITTHYEKIEAITEFSQTFAKSYLEEHSRGQAHAGFIFYFLLKSLYGSLSAGLDYINGVLRQAEKRIFAGEEKAMVKNLSAVNHNLLDFRWALKTHRQLLDSLVLAGQDFFGDNFKYHLASIVGEYEKIWNMLESNRETFFDLRQTNDSLLSIKTNETTKILAVLAFIFFPLTIVTQFFGMNTNLPLIGGPNDYLAVIGIMALAMAMMLIWARSRRWF